MTYKVLSGTEIFKIRFLCITRDHKRFGVRATLTKTIAPRMYISMLTSCGVEIN